MTASISFLSILGAEGLGAQLISFLDAAAIIHFSNVSKKLHRILKTEIQSEKTIALLILATRIEKMMRQDLMLLLTPVNFRLELSTYNQSFKPFIIKQACTTFKIAELEFLMRFHSSTQETVSLLQPYLAIKSRLALDSDFETILSRMKRHIEHSAMRPAHSRTLSKEPVKEKEIANLETTLAKALFIRFIPPPIQENSEISKTKTHIRFIVAGFLKESQTGLEQYFCTVEALALLEKTWSVFFETIQTQDFSQK